MIAPEESGQQRSTASSGLGVPGAEIVWHVITCEYPPQPGGVSDYAFLLAQGLASLQDEVHIWGPNAGGPAPSIARVSVHTSLGKFSPADLRRTSGELNTFAGPRYLLLQYVPHGFGYKSLNVFLCLWLWFRAFRRGDVVGVMVHEPFLEFNRRNLAQSLAAVVHRLMMVILLRTATHVWVSTPAWIPRIRPFAWGRRHTYGWLPLPSNVPVLQGDAEISAIHERYASGGLLIGHFGTFGPLITPLLHAIIPPLLSEVASASLVLIGPGGQAFRDQLLQAHPDLEDRVHALGAFNARDPRLSFHLSACDLLIQPYPDGITSRRTTIMAALSHGRPTVTTIGALTESFWASSGAVATAAAHDDESFVRAAVQLLKDPQARAVLGKDAQQYYRREFDIHRIVELLRVSVLSRPKAER